MRILFYIHRYPGYGGIEKVTTYLANFFVDKFEWVGIYSFIQQAESELLIELDSKVHYFKCQDNVEYANNLQQLRDIYVNNHIQGIIFQDSYAPIEKVLFQSVRRTNIKIYTVEHNTPDCFIKSLKVYAGLSWVSKLKKYILHPYYLSKTLTRTKARHKKLLINSDIYILLSERYRDILKCLIPDKSFDKKIYAINNPITISIPIVCPSKAKKMCVFCGRLSNQKGIKYLMDIWRNVQIQNSEWTLLILGDGEEMKYVLDYIKFYKLKNIILKGFQSNTTKYYSDAQILLMTSVFEGWPLVLGEAMSFGCIPFAFNSFATASEIIENNGFLIKPFDVNDYSKKLLQLMDNENLRCQFKMAAYESVKKYSIANIVQVWINILIYGNCK